MSKKDLEKMEAAAEAKLAEAKAKAEEKTEAPKPVSPPLSCGRIVLYKLSDDVVRPAMVLCVEGDICFLQVFLRPSDAALSHIKEHEAWAGMAYRSGVKQGPHPLQWSWPPRV